MMSVRETAGTMRMARSKMRSMLWSVVSVSALSSIPSAVGPSITVPSTVGMTRMPFEFGVGVGKSTRRGRPEALRSSRISSPLRGRMRKDSAPNRRETSSARSPAALTTRRAVTSSAAADARRYAPSARSTRVTSKPTRRSTPFLTADSVRAKA